MGNHLKNLLLWGALFVLVIFLFHAFTGGGQRAGVQAVPLSSFYEQVRSGDIDSVEINGEEIMVTTVNGQTFTTIRPREVDVTPVLLENGVRFAAKSQKPNGFITFLAPLLPFAILIGIWLYIMNRMQGGGRGGALGFGKSKAKMLTERQGRITFADVAGIDEAKEELEEIVDFLRDPGKFSRLGGKIPTGALLVGPPGTGKTLLARAIAGEAGVPFFSISGSDFVEMFVGVGASRVRDMFTQATRNAPCIVFIDEIDAVGRSRGIGIGGGNDEREQTLNQLLVEMDGFEDNDGVIIVAATNRPDVLDPALLRPGRFDRQVEVPIPDVTGRERILEVHVKKIERGPDVDLRALSRATPGFSGADIANLVNESALLAARVGRSYVTMEDFESAKDKVMMGAERRSLVMTEEERQLTAYHEAGHAIVGMSVPQHDPIYKATIIPRGRTLGAVLSFPERDQLSHTRTKYRSKIAMAMGGKAAEELKFGAENVTSGAASDIKQVSRIARAMVTQFGMSDTLGNIDYAHQEDTYLGPLHQGASVSPATQDQIDAEVRKICDWGYQTAKGILKDKWKDVERLAQGLLEYETLSGDEISLVLAGKSLNKEDKGDDESKAAPAATRLPSSRRAQSAASEGRLEEKPT